MKTKFFDKSKRQIRFSRFELFFRFQIGSISQQISETIDSTDQERENHFIQRALNETENETLTSPQRTPILDFSSVSPSPFTV